MGQVKPNSKDKIKRFDAIARTANDCYCVAYAPTRPATIQPLRHLCVKLLSLNEQEILLWVNLKLTAKAKLNGLTRLRLTANNRYCGAYAPTRPAAFAPLFTTARSTTPPSLRRHKLRFNAFVKSKANFASLCLLFPQNLCEQIFCGNPIDQDYSNILTKRRQVVNAFVCTAEIKIIKKFAQTLDI